MKPGAENDRVAGVVLGVGNRLCRDDGVGSLVAERLAAAPPAGWHVIDAGVAPEDFTGPIRRWRPALLLIVDAMDMGLAPGSVRRVSPERLAADDGFNSHHPSLRQLCDYLAPVVGSIVVVAVQPAVTDLAPDAGLTGPVARAAARLARMLAGGRIEAITALG